jgi:hypothetical protein
MPKKINKNVFVPLDFQGSNIASIDFLSIDIPFLPDEIIIKNVNAHFPAASTNNYKLSCNIMGSYQTISYFSDIGNTALVLPHKIKYIITDDQKIQGSYNFRLNFTSGAANNVNVLVQLTLEFIKYLDH